MICYAVIDTNVLVSALLSSKDDSATVLVLGKSKVLLLTDGDELISFCTYAEKDDIQPTELTPWMGFVYTFPEHRGHHYVGLLMEEVERLAIKEGVSEVYISTNHIGLYEKYGCEFKTEMKDMNGELSRVYVKLIRKQERL